MQYMSFFFSESKVLIINYYLTISRFFLIIYDFLCFLSFESKHKMLFSLNRAHDNCILLGVFKLFLYFTYAVYLKYIICCNMGVETSANILMRQATSENNCCSNMLLMIHFCWGLSHHTC